MTYVYRVPDGSDDRPDENGQHTKKVNVVHSAKQFARFPGCDSCRLIVEMETRTSDDPPPFWTPDYHGIAGE